MIRDFFSTLRRFVGRGPSTLTHIESASTGSDIFRGETLPDGAVDKGEGYLDLGEREGDFDNSDSGDEGGSDGGSESSEDESIVLVCAL